MVGKSARAKKLDLSEKEFKNLIKLPIKKHQEYGADEGFIRC